MKFTNTKLVISMLIFLSIGLTGFRSVSSPANDDHDAAVAKLNVNNLGAPITLDLSKYNGANNTSDYEAVMQALTKTVVNGSSVKSLKLVLMYYTTIQKNNIFRKIGEFKDIENMEELDLASSSLGTPINDKKTDFAAMSNTFQKMQSLKTLDLSMNALTAKQLIMLWPTSANFRKLEYLALDYNKINDVSDFITLFRNGQFANLTYLSMEGAIDGTKASLTPLINEISKLNKLHTLSLANVYMLDESVKILANSKLTNLY